MNSKFVLWLNLTLLFLQVTSSCCKKCNEKKIVRRYSISEKELLEKKKLMLLLDLDNTIIGSTELEVEIYDFQVNEMYVCLREGYKIFLMNMAKKYVIGIHTNGSQEYADAVVKHLDPEKNYITAGVFSSRNSHSLKKSTDEFNSYFKHEIPENMIQIVDDQPKVWVIKDQPKIHRVSPWNPYQIFDDCDELDKNHLTFVQENLLAFHHDFFDE